MLAIRHTQCAHCGQFFPISWMYNNHDEQGYKSPTSGEHFCSKRCCELAEGDSMQNAFDLQACPACGKMSLGEFCSEGCAKEDRLDRM